MGESNLLMCSVGKSVTVFTSWTGAAEYEVLPPEGALHCDYSSAAQNTCCIATLVLIMVNSDT